MDAPLSIRIRHDVDGDPLIHDTLLYVADAGYPFKVEGVRYFIYGFSLVKQDNSLVSLGGLNLVDSRNPSSQSVYLGEAPSGDYIGLDFYLGLPAAQDTADAFLNNPDYQEMALATPSSGAYRYLRFEGVYMYNDSLNPFRLELAGTFSARHYTLLKNITVDPEGTRLDLIMNLSEWLRNPHDYDFVADGPFSLQNDSSLNYLAENGSDVFRFE